MPRLLEWPLDHARCRICQVSLSLRRRQLPALQQRLDQRLEAVVRELRGLHEGPLRLRGLVAEERGDRALQLGAQEMLVSELVDGHGDAQG